MSSETLLVLVMLSSHHVYLRHQHSSAVEVTSPHLHQNHHPLRTRPCSSVTVAARKYLLPTHSSSNPRTVCIVQPGAHVDDDKKEMARGKEKPYANVPSHSPVCDGGEEGPQWRLPWEHCYHLHTCNNPQRSNVALPAWSLFEHCSLFFFVFLLIRLLRRLGSKWKLLEKVSTTKPWLVMATTQKDS